MDLARQEQVAINMVRALSGTAWALPSAGGVTTTP